MAHALELSYNWRPPVVISTAALVACIGILARGQVRGWFAVALVLVGIWTLFGGVVWFRTRAYMMVDGPILTVRRFRQSDDLDGRKVTRVKAFLTPTGPSFKVFCEGEQRPHKVPTSLLKKGSSTLFDWVLTWAPNVELDKGSRKTLDELRTRGMIG